jgi:hypothetical protein
MQVKPVCFLSLLLLLPGRYLLPGLLMIVKTKKA